MSPVPSLGVISLTKFTSPEEVTRVLGDVVPGTTTALEIKNALGAAGQPDPLWNDLLAYDPPLVKASATAGRQVAVDNELLRACRAHRDDRFLLLWVALNSADPRLDEIVREVLTDAAGHLVPAEVNAPRLANTLDNWVEQGILDVHGTKVVSNILSLLERCRLIVPQKHGSSIVGIERALPTRHAVPGAVQLIQERLGDAGLRAVPGQEVELALAIGTFAWLNLSPDDFRFAYTNPSGTARTQSKRTPAPSDLTELATQLRRNGQVVLQGPPGAGKTFVARRYIGWATADRSTESQIQTIIDELPENHRTVSDIADEVIRLGLCCVWDIVQFHPGYDYTDFVRALVAQPHGDGVTFVAQHRILSLISALGRELKHRNYDLELVLILDEINRGDIPHIFGELLYALEYRDEAVSTPYTVNGDGSLTIPSSLKVLGTMNTADRSIAVIDYALRRRFVFLDVPATDGPIRTFDYDSEEARSAALYLYGLTSEALATAAQGLRVGPSYFLARPDGSESTLRVLSSRYVYEVLPLLTEYELEGEVERGTIAKLRSDLAIPSSATQRQSTDGLIAHLDTRPWNLAVRGPATVDLPAS